MLNKKKKKNQKYLAPSCGVLRGLSLNTHRISNEIIFVHKISQTLEPCARVKWFSRFWSELNVGSVEDAPLVSQAAYKVAERRRSCSRLLHRSSGPRIPIWSGHPPVGGTEVTNTNCPQCLVLNNTSKSLPIYTRCLPDQEHQNDYSITRSTNPLNKQDKTTANKNPHRSPPPPTFPYLHNYTAAALLADWIFV